MISDTLDEYSGKHDEAQDRIAELEAENTKYLACVDRLVGDLGRETGDRQEDARRHQFEMGHARYELAATERAGAGTTEFLRKAWKERDEARAEVVRLENMVKVLNDSNDRLSARPTMPWQPREDFDDKLFVSDQYLVAVPLEPTLPDLNWWEVAVVEIQEDAPATVYGHPFDFEWADADWVIPIKGHNLPKGT